MALVDGDNSGSPTGADLTEIEAEWMRRFRVASAADDPGLLPSADGLSADRLRFYGGLAASAGNLRLLTHLVEELGIDPSVPYMFGYTPMSGAADSGRAECVVYLLGRGADTELGTPLRRAASQGHFDVVKLLVEAGADVNQGDPEDLSALELAEGAGHTEVAEYLRAHGATRRAEVEVEHAPGSLMAHLTETLAPVVPVLLPADHPYRRG